MIKRGRFITFEGIDGAGKSTQIDALENYLKERGVRVIRTREPGGTPLAEQIRSLLLTNKMTPRTETLLFFAARSEHIADVINPALESGAWVLSDRFTDATYAYQVGGRGFSGEDVEVLEAWTQKGLTPDLTVLFDLPPDIAARRMLARNPDRFEQESRLFFERVRNAYLTRAQTNANRFYVVDATETPAHIEATLIERFAKEIDVWQ